MDAVADHDGLLGRAGDIQTAGGHGGLAPGVLLAVGKEEPFLTNIPSRVCRVRVIDVRRRRLGKDVGEHVLALAQIIIWLDEAGHESRLIFRGTLL